MSKRPRKGVAAKVRASMKAHQVRKRRAAMRDLRELLSAPLADLWDRYHDQPTRYAWAIRTLRGTE